MGILRKKKRQKERTKYNKASIQSCPSRKQPLSSGSRPRRKRRNMMTK